MKLKKAISVILAILSLLLLLNACGKGKTGEASNDENQPNNDEIIEPNIDEEQYSLFQFVLLGNNTYEVRKGKITNQEDITIPNVYNNKAVTSIAQSAFSGCSSIINVTIPDTVTNIGSYAFYDCTNLTTINIPESIASIGTFPFGGCEKLTYSVFDNGKYLGNGENKYFYLACGTDKDIKDIQINDKTKIIGNYAFAEFEKLSTVTVPDSVRAIGEYSFSECIGLSEIYLSKNITEIGAYAFENCKALTDIVIPEGVEKISADTFIGCIGLKSATLPVSVKTIGLWAFEGCTNMENINYLGTKEQCVAITIGTDKLGSLLISNNTLKVKEQFITINYDYIPEEITE